MTTRTTPKVDPQLKRWATGITGNDRQSTVLYAAAEFRIESEDIPRSAQDKAGLRPGNRSHFKWTASILRAIDPGTVAAIMSVGSNPSKADVDKVHDLAAIMFPIRKAMSKLARVHGSSEDDIRAMAADCATPEDVLSVISERADAPEVPEEIDMMAPEDSGESVSGMDVWVRDGVTFAEELASITVVLENTDPTILTDEERAAIGGLAAALKGLVSA